MKINKAQKLTIAQFLRILRKKKNINVSTVTKQTKIVANNIYKWEQNKYKPNAKNLQILLKYYNSSVSQLCKSVNEEQLEDYILYYE
jgi:transcriptional regulator with XRE-family HTH domain